MLMVPKFISEQNSPTYRAGHRAGSRVSIVGGALWPTINGTVG
jgi:hypothetical protein